MFAEKTACKLSSGKPFNASGSLKGVGFCALSPAMLSSFLCKLTWYADIEQAISLQRLKGSNGPLIANTNETQFCQKQSMPCDAAGKHAEHGVLL